MIWRLAEWLYWNVFDFIYPACERFCMSWKDESETVKNHMYDKAAELMKKIQMNEFTGEDTHKD